MKQFFTFSLFLFSILTFSQLPEGFSYQAVALDANGKPVVNGDIGVRISILDDSKDGNVVYEETHSPKTNEKGLYSLNIGQGLATKAIFFDINWAKSSKFFKIEVDPTGGTNYIITGTNQFMSVPYALMAKTVIDSDSTNDNLDCFDSIQALRDYSQLPNHGDIACVAGHSSFRDGGQGTFYYISDLELNDDDGIVIKPNNNIVPQGMKGRWVRHIDGYINVNYYGIKGGNQTSINGISLADKIQDIINFAALNTRWDHVVTSGNNPDNPNNELISEYTKGNTVFFPNGEYKIDSPLILKSGVSIIGEKRTIFTAISSFDYFFKIDEGPILVEIENLILNGNLEPEVGGIYFNSSPSPHFNNTGGVWKSTFKNMEIIRINGHGIHIEGGDNTQGDFNRPNQFNIFENVTITRVVDNKHCLLTTGQLGQHTFINCEFNGNSINLLGQNVSLNKGDVVSFINCSFQNSEYGIVTNGSTSITIDNCWFESLKIAVTALDNSRSINILNSRFANACGYGSLMSTDGGRCITSKNSWVNVENNYVLVSDRFSTDAHEAKFILGLDDNNVINAKNNSFQHIGLSKTHGIMQTLSLTNNTLNSDGKKLISVHVSGTTVLNKINSSISTGERIFLRANGEGVLVINKMSTVSDGNIFLSNSESISLINGQMAELVKIENIVGDEPSTYQLISISK